MTVRTDSDAAELLRRRAEELCSRDPEQVIPADLRGIQKLAHELAVHQAELKFQNDELQETLSSLQRARDRFAALFENAPAGYVVLDRAGIIRHTNATWRRLADEPEREWRGVPFAQAMVEEDAPLFLARFRSFFRNPESKSITVRIRRRGGGSFHARIEAAPRELQSAEESAGAELLVLVTDISDLQSALDRLEERNRELAVAEASLKRRAARLAALVEILQFPATGVQELLDHALERAIALTGSAIGYIYHYDEHARQFILNSWSRDVMPACRVVDPQTRYDLDATGCWGDAVRSGRPVIMNDFAAPDPRRKGIPEGHVPLARFLTVPLRHHGRIVAVVGVANKATDYSEFDVLELTLLMESAWQAVETIRAEQAKEAARGQLAQAAKMESMGRLAGGVAHDFNNMLGVILGHAEMALAAPALGREVRESLEEILGAARHSVAITRQLLAFARRQPIRPVAIDLNGAVERTFKMLRRLIGEEAELAFRPGEGAGAVRLDPVQFEQILANLCVNARDALAGPGKILLATATTVVGPGEAHAEGDLVNPVLPGEFATLTVTDDGRGMDEFTLRHIFEPFFSTKETGKGTGLGLATVHGIVRQNGGFLRVESTPGAGTAFTVHLPRLAESDTPAARPDPSDAPAAVPRGQGETVLLVEDEPAMLELVRMMLEALGYAVIPEPSPEAALARFDGHADRIDLLLTDVVMPGMNGRQLAARLAERRPGLPAVFMSGHPLDAMARHGMLEPGIRFLQKPFELPAFAAMLREALGKAAEKRG